VSENDTEQQAQRKVALKVIMYENLPTGLFSKGQSTLEQFPHSKSLTVVCNFPV